MARDLVADLEEDRDRGDHLGGERGRDVGRLVAGVEVLAVERRAAHELRTGVVDGRMRLRGI
jgi:hypothetical protein